MRANILSEIKRLAATNNGTPPGQKLFESAAGIAPHQWRGRYWARWGDALVEAGFEPNSWQEKLDGEALIHRLADLILALGHLPTSSELDLLRRKDRSLPSAKTLRSHFSGQDGVFDQLRSLANTDGRYAKLALMLPAQQKRQAVFTNKAIKHGYVYLIKSGEHYKIGRSDEIERRLKEIKVSLPEQAVLLHAIETDDPSGIEAYWHRRFADKRANGEWFKLSKHEVQAFKRRRFQ